ncbi:hypothetical protein ACEPPN_004904 [Leptodophora sp. 'Broadleaf-Isolate-01']
MAARISDMDKDFIDKEASDTNIFLPATGQYDQDTVEDLLRNVKTAHEIINCQEEDISQLSEQVKAANNRAEIAERAVQNAAVTTVQDVGISSVENARLRAENNLLSALIAASNQIGEATSTNEAGCTNETHGISEQNLKELLDFANENTDTGPALEWKLQLLASLLAKCQQGGSSGGQLYSGSRTNSGGNYEIDFNEYIRLVDETIKNAHILRNRAHIPKDNFGTGSLGQVDTPVHLGKDIWGLTPELNEANTEMSLLEDIDADFTKLNDALTTATTQIRGLNAQVMNSHTRIEELEASQGIDSEGTDNRVLALIAERDNLQRRLDYYLENRAPTPGASQSKLEHLNDQIRHLLADGADLTQRLAVAQDRIFTLESEHLTIAEAEAEQIRLRLLLDECMAQNQALLRPALGPDVDIADLSRRANRVSGLEAELKDANEVVRCLQARLAGDRAAADQAEMDSLNRRVQELTQDLDTADQAKGEAEAELAEQKLVSEDLTWQLAGLSQQNADLTQERTAVEKVRDDALEEVNNQLSEVERLQALLADSEKARNQQVPAQATVAAPRAETTKLKKQVKELRTERDALQAQLDAIEQDPELTATVRGLQTQVDDLNKELKKAQRNKKRAETKSTKAEAEVNRLSHLLDTREATVDRIRGERTAARADRDALRIRVQVAEEALGVDGVELQAQLQQAKAAARQAEAAQFNLITLNQDTSNQRDQAGAPVVDTKDIITDLEAQLQAESAIQQAQLESCQSSKEILLDANAILETAISSLQTKLKNHLEGNPGRDDEQLIGVLEEVDRVQRLRENDRRQLADKSHALRGQLEDAEAAIRDLVKENEELRKESKHCIEQLSAKVSGPGIKHAMLVAEVKKLLEITGRLHEELEAVKDLNNKVSPADVKERKKLFQGLLRHTIQIQEWLENLVEAAAPGVDDDTDLKAAIDILGEQNEILQRGLQGSMDSKSVDEREHIITNLESQVQALNNMLALATDNYSSELPNQASLFTAEKNAFIIDIETWQQRVRELNLEIEELKDQIEELKKENAKLVADLNNTKIELFGKISGAVDHLREEEMAKKLEEGLSAGDLSDDVSVDIITEHAPVPAGDKPLPTRKKRLAGQDSTPKRTKKSAKHVEPSPGVPEKSAEPEKRSTRSSKRKSAASETGTKQSQPAGKKRRAG